MAAGTDLPLSANPPGGVAAASDKALFDVGFSYM